MNVLLLTSYTAGSYGNQFFHYYLGDHINRYRYFGHVTACCKIKENDNIGYAVDMENVEIKEIKKVNSIPSLIKYTWRNKKVIDREIQKADLIICYVPTYLASYAVARAKKYNKKILAVGVACVWDVYWNHSLKGKLIAPFSFLNMRRIMKKADYSIYVTSEFLQRRYPPKNRSIGISDVILEDFDDQLLHARLESIKNDRRDFKIDPFKIITCAALNVKYKRQEDVIMAISKLKDYNIHYYLAGGGDNSRLVKIAEKYGVADKVHFLGMLKREEIFKTLDSMDLYIQPSKTEGLPRAIVEAMSRALPAIGSSVGGIPELLGEQCTFRKGNLDEMQNLLVKMLDKTTRLELSERNYQKAKEFDADVLNKKRTDFFQSIVKDFNN